MLGSDHQFNGVSVLAQFLEEFLNFVSRATDHDDNDAEEKDQNAQADPENSVFHFVRAARQIVEQGLEKAW